MNSNSASSHSWTVLRSKVNENGVAGIDLGNAVLVSLLMKDYSGLFGICRRGPNFS